jgi:hypothetical protein
LPSPDLGTALPPPLAPARDRYILFKSGDGAFDVYDGEEMIGDLYRQDGDRDRKTVWIATLAQARFDGFTTLKAAKDWLGQPPVRKYRREAHSKRLRRPARPTAPLPDEKQS